MVSPSLASAACSSRDEYYALVVARGHEWARYKPCESEFSVRANSFRVRAPIPPREHVFPRPRTRGSVASPGPAAHELRKYCLPADKRGPPTAFKSVLKFFTPRE
ncbi:hypothetical protein WN48_08331 [Eufriesea mexicana]|uniref:Uncharacterized protein n=1 Tax=Eufriesea mexicana TaxID=516756 RepID=A0A310S7Y2_9HYME|nr:hypothetical protein WN48_08331 [Eufriesea mexicana]